MYGARETAHCLKKQRKEIMKKFLLLLLVGGALAACGGACETEPLVEQNHKLIVPPNFGQMPK